LIFSSLSTAFSLFQKFTETVYISNGLGINALMFYTIMTLYGCERHNNIWFAHFAILYKFVPKEKQLHHFGCDTKNLFLSGSQNIETKKLLQKLSKLIEW